MSDSTTDSGTTQQQAPAADASAPVAPPAHVATAAETLVEHLKTAGQAELTAAKPLIGQIVRQFVAQYESHLTGITGMVVRPMINSVLDAIFGPATA